MSEVKVNFPLEYYDELFEEISRFSIFISKHNWMNEIHNVFSNRNFGRQDIVFRKGLEMLYRVRTVVIESEVFQHSNCQASSDFNFLCSMNADFMVKGNQTGKLLPFWKELEAKSLINCLCETIIWEKIGIRAFWEEDSSLVIRYCESIVNV